VLISAGTAIQLKDKRFYNSVVGKNGIERGSKLVPITNFHHLDRTSVRVL